MHVNGLPSPAISLESCGEKFSLTDAEGIGLCVEREIERGLREAEEAHFKVLGSDIELSLQRDLGSGGQREPSAGRCHGVDSEELGVTQWGQLRAKSGNLDGAHGEGAQRDLASACNQLPIKWSLRDGGTRKVAHGLTRCHFSKSEKVESRAKGELASHSMHPESLGRENLLLAIVRLPTAKRGERSHSLYILSPCHAIQEGESGRHRA
jgi:hypothetical protein